MRISLLGWKCTGLRCPDMEVNLAKTKGANYPHTVSLIQMPNGTGKTTTLNMLRAALSGRAEGWKEEEILSYKALDHDAHKGQFVVNLGIDDKRVTIELNLEFSDPKVHYRTVFGAGIEEGWSPPTNLRPFLSKNFINLFVFDGELATDLLNSQKTRAKEAIDALFQLYLLEEICNCFEDYWKEKTEKIALTEKGLKQRNARYTKLKESLGKLRAQRARTQKKREALELRQTEMEKRYNELLYSTQKYGDEMKLVQNSLHEKEDHIKEQTTKMLDKSRDPHCLLDLFCKDLLDLKENLDVLKLPRSTSKAFFYEIADESNKECICGAELDDLRRKKILEKAEQFLEEDETGILNSVKSDIRDLSTYDYKFFSGEYTNMVQTLDNLVRERDSLEAKRKVIENEILKLGGEELETLKGELMKIDEELTSLTDDLNELDRDPKRDDGDDSRCIKHIQRALKEAEMKLAEATKTVNLRKKINTIKAMLEDATCGSRERINEIILSETNERMGHLLPLELVQLEKIENCLKLRDKDQGSVGQTLALGYSFLSTLFSQGEHDLPFIVDSPVGALDGAVRKEVAKIIPKLCSQFVAFMISTEKENFLQPLQKEISNIQYLTIFRKNEKTVELIPKSPHKETVNGIVIEDKEYFQGFYHEEE